MYFEEGCDTAQTQLDAHFHIDNAQFVELNLSFGTFSDLHYLFNTITKSVL